MILPLREYQLKLIKKDPVAFCKYALGIKLKPFQVAHIRAIEQDAKRNKEGKG